MAKIIVNRKGKGVKVSQATNDSSPIPIPGFDIESVKKLIKNRRSIFPKDFSDETIPREQIELLLEMAHWAPSHGKTEPWHFQVFSGEGLTKFGQSHADLYKKHTSPGKYNQDKYDKLIRRASQTSHMIAICMKRGSNPKIPEIEEIEAVACAAENLWLTATALGIAGYWTSGGMTYHSEMKELLGLGESDKCLGFFLLGKPKNGWAEGKRMSEWQSKVVWKES